VNTIVSKDGTEIYFKDWGKGPVVTFFHGWSTFNIVESSHL
jgi:non-heme chloroperoxidase